MSVWSEVFLGVIAVATLAMAIAQVGVFIAASLLARRVARLMDQVERELKPAFGHVNAIGRDASRAGPRSSPPANCSRAASRNGSPCTWAS